MQPDMHGFSDARGQLDPCSLVQSIHLASLFFKYTWQ